MFRNTAFSSLAVLAAVVAVPLGALAQSGYDVTGHVAPDVGNVVGGGGATLLGGGDDMVILYSRSGAGGGGDWAQSGRSARFAGTTGDGPEVEYTEAAPAGAGRGRVARLLGGGDNAEVVYAPAAGR